MTCSEVRQHWDLYHDSEGDSALHFQLNEHLANCPDCAQWFSQQSRLEYLLAEKLKPAPESPELWNQVLSHCGLKQPVVSRSWLWMASVTACAAALLLVVFWGKLFVSRPDLSQLTVERHQRLAAGMELVEFVSNDDIEVDEFLKKRVSFPVRCPPRKNTGFEVRGAGVCRLADQSAAYLSGHLDTTPVSIFVLPRDSLDNFPLEQKFVRPGNITRSRKGPYQVAMGIIHQNAVVVIGQTDAERLDRVLRAYGTYPH